jgi:hypothetical protein
MGSFICVHLRHLRIRPLRSADSGDELRDKVRLAPDLIYPQMDADLRRWRMDGQLLSAFICVICGFVLCAPQIQEMSFATRFVWREI